MKSGLLMTILLFIAVTASALGVVYAKHQARALFVEMETVRKQRDELDIEWGQLSLEQSTWATHGRIEELARTRLQMTIPRHTDIVVIRP